MSFFSAEPTCFAHCPRPLAWLTVLAALTLLGFGLSVIFHPQPPPEPAPETPSSGATDLDLYEAIINRMHRGETYYAVTGEELPQRGYPTSSVFNWRLPTYAWFLAPLPSMRIGQGVLILLSGWTIYLSVRFTAAAYGKLPAVGALIWLVGAFTWCVDGKSFLTQEVWSGVLIQLSIIALGQGQYFRGVTAGVTALLIRELVLPYVLLCLAIALWQRRWRESLGWVFGLVLYALFTAFHVSQVKQYTPIEELNVPSTWLCWGGIGFVLETVRMNQMLILTHVSVRAVYLPFAFVGLLGWRGETGVRIFLTCLGYDAAFLAVGQPFNAYWGILTAPVLSMGAAIAPWAIRDLYHCVRPEKSVQPANLPVAGGV
jgi:hypothetical protein